MYSGIASVIRNENEMITIWLIEYLADFVLSTLL